MSAAFSSEGAELAKKAQSRRAWCVGYTLGGHMEEEADNIDWAVKGVGYPARWVWIWFASWQRAAIVWPKWRPPCKGV